MLARISSLESVQFTTFCSTSVLLGTTTSRFSPVTIRVLRAPIRRITPVTDRDPSNCTTSPTRTGRSMSRISPLMKLLRMFWLANPTPIASAPPANANSRSGKFTTSSASSSTISASA